MSSPLPDLDALPHDGLKRLVAQLLGRVSVLEEENRQLRDENARLKDLPKRPQLAPYYSRSSWELVRRRQWQRRARC